MKPRFNSIPLLLAIATICTVAITKSQADPLPLRDFLKFDQEPMINTTVNTTGVVYSGHDEISTIYGPGNNAAQPVYQGPFMADDFSDTVSRTVVHVTWWGSYHNTPGAVPGPPVQQFMIGFEADDPAINGQPSHPKAPLQYEIVNPGVLTPASGTFTETPTGVQDINGDFIFKYNAELANPFPEQANTVYWLKIAAVVNLPVGTPVPPPPGFTNWGWHNRDYTIQDTLAAPVSPGEVNLGTPNNPIWHFQDDAVQGSLTYLPAGTGINGQIIMQNPIAQNYVDFADGPQGIGNFSKDLAFRLYTTQTIPEPTSCLLMTIGLAAIGSLRRRPSAA
jgi:hypothetical protein